MVEHVVVADAVAVAGVVVSAVAITSAAAVVVVVIVSVWLILLVVLASVPASIQPFVDRVLARFSMQRCPVE